MYPRLLYGFAENPRALGGDTFSHGVLSGVVGWQIPGAHYRPRAAHLFPESILLHALPTL